MTPLHTLALLLCAVGVLLATCLVIRAAFRRRSLRRQALEQALEYRKRVERSLVLSSEPLASRVPPKPYSEFDPLHWNKKPL